MDISPAGLDLIKKWEGFYPNAYDDGEGVWTIGYGTVRWDLKTPVKKGDSITKEEAERQLRKELQRVEDAIDESIKQPINQCEFDSFCATFYNIGTGWCTGKGHQQATFVKNFNAGRKDLVPAGMLQFTRGANSGKVYQGLLNRRRDEVKLFLSPAVAVAPHDETKPVPDEPMPQAVAPAPVSVVKTVKTSQTIKGAILAALAFLADKAVSAYDWLFSVAKEAGPEVLSLKTAVGPFDALFGLLKASMPLVLGALTIAGIWIVIARRISAAKEQRIG